MTNTKHQLGVEAARSGQRRDERMSAEWLAGFDAEAGAPKHRIIGGLQEALVHTLSKMERAEMERLTLEVHAAFEELATPRADRENDISAGEKVFRGAERERAHIVEWLMRHANGELSSNYHVQGAAAAFANAIERGQHIEGDE